jgi:uncharacterized protein with HEPN domain
MEPNPKSWYLDSKIHRKDNSILATKQVTRWWFLKDKETFTVFILWCLLVLGETITYIVSS